MAAQKPYSDSLKRVLAHTNNPVKKVDLLCDIAYDLFDFDDSAAWNYALEAKQVAKENHYQEGLKHALTTIGLGNFISGKYGEALVALRASKDIQASPNRNLAGYNLMLIGSVFRDLGSYDSAEHYYHNAIQVVGENGDPYYLGLIYWGLANTKTILWQHQEALDYLRKAEGYSSKRPGDYYVLMKIWDTYGRVYDHLLDFKKADAYYRKMCEQEKRNNDFLLRIKCFMHESEAAIRLGNLSQALSSSFQALEVSDIYRCPQQRAQVYDQIGFIYSELSQYALAIQYFLEGLKISERAGLRFETANLYSRLAWVYKDESSFEQAHENLNKAEAIRTAIGDRLGLSDCQNIRGLVYYLQKEYDKSMAEFNKSLAIRRTVGNELKEMAVVSNMSLVLEATGKNNMALEYQLKALALEEKLDSRTNMAISYTSLSLLMVKMKRFREGEFYLKKALDLSWRINSKILRRNAYLNYAKLCEASGDLKKAIEFHTRYEALDDSIFSEASSVKLAEMQALYQVEKKEQEIQLLDRQKNAQEQELGAQRQVAAQQRFIITLGLVAILTLLLAGVIIVRYSREKNRDNRILQKLNREISEQKEEIQAQSEELMEASDVIANINRELEAKIDERTSELKQAYKELDTFFYRASHDFRRPITTFMGLAGVAKITVKDTASLELFEKVSDTANSLDKMLYKLQSISDVGSQQMVFKDVFLKELIEEVLDGCAKLIQQKKITVSLEIDEQISLVSYPAMVKIIVENIIENAVQFAGFEKPFISIRGKVTPAAAVIEVQDNGQGIQDQYQSRIFEMYFRANEHSKGNGLGLYITKKAAEKLSGSISFKSRHGSGSLFTIELPNHDK
ncbi:MAG TPA: tetratricopeptide repeat protein [Cyclobacteriaceae bacterium]|nr:tetratricopeptide repeat protein [Cyclobacteriaceae bacterium]